MGLLVQQQSVLISVICYTTYSLPAFFRLPLTCSLLTIYSDTRSAPPFPTLPLILFTSHRFTCSPVSRSWGGGVFHHFRPCLQLTLDSLALYSLTLYSLALYSLALYSLAVLS